MRLRTGLWAAGALLCALITVGGPAMAQFTNAPLRGLSGAPGAGAVSGTDTLWLCQLAGGCGVNDPMKSASIGLIDTYLSAAATALTNHTIDCHLNTCLNFPGGGGGGFSGMSAGQVPIAATATTGTGSLPLSGSSGGTEIVSTTSASKTNGHLLTWDANGNAIDGGAPAGGSTPANPTASIGAAVVNGSASTYMRSDAAPPIGANAVTNALLAQGAANTLKGNNTGGTANEADLTVSQVKALLAYTFPDIPAGTIANGSTATTQTTGDNTTKIATDAFVLANAGAGAGNMTGSGLGTAGDVVCVNTTATPLNTAVDCGFAPLSVDDPASASPTVAQWANGDYQVAAGTAITLPGSSTLARNGSLTYMVISNTVLNASGSDVITTSAGTTGAGGNITLLAGNTVTVTSKGSGTFKASGNGTSAGLPTIANGHILGNATGSSAAAQDTTVAAGTGISVAASGGTLTIANTRGVGNFFLIATQTATSGTTAELDFVSANWSSSYNSVVLKCSNLVSSTLGDNINIQATENGGSTWLATNYSTTRQYVDSTGANAASRVTAGTSYLGVAADVANTPAGFTFTLDNPASTTVFKQATAVYTYTLSGFTYGNAGWEAYVGDTGAINGLRVVNTSSHTFGGVCTLSGMN